MTTVAFCGKRLVADSQATIGNRRRLGPAKKIFVAEEGDSWTLLGQTVVAWGMAGNAGAVEVIKAAMTKGVGLEQMIVQKNMSFSVIAITASGKAYFWSAERNAKSNEDRHEIIPITGPMAIGSGQTIAESVLALGKGARAAVKLACKLDTGSGGPLQVYKLPFEGAKKFKG